MDQVFEGGPKAEIRLDGRKVTRTAVSNDWGTRLQWRVSRDGKVVATPLARIDLSYEHLEKTPGAYEIVLEMWKYEGYKAGPNHGKYVEISNKVTYSV
jgi:hypothetical protein